MDRVTSPFAAMLARSWVVLLVRGLTAIAFGVLTWARPDITLTALVILFGVYAVIDGILAISTALAARHSRKFWWVLLLAGVVGVGVGIATFLTPGITALALLFYIAAWAITRGVLEVIAGFSVLDEVKGEWRFILAGFASVLFGVLLIMHPSTGALAVLWLLALYALVAGLLLVTLAFKMRSLREHLVGA